MKENYALRYIQKLVDWDESRLTDEVGWLRRIAAYKYDSYQDFFAGDRFISAFIRWLGQFAPADRDFAYALLKEHLVFLSAGEIQHLVRRTVPAHFRPHWLRRVADSFHIAPYEIGSKRETVDAYKRLMRRSLFVGLSDGARIDAFRRANVGVISNEQVVVSYELPDTKLKSLLADLKKEENSADAVFEMVFLIDDFLCSGTTLCRTTKDGWKGKLEKFGRAIAANAGELLDPNFELIAHHYVATEFGLEKAAKSVGEFAAQTSDKNLQGKTCYLTADLILSSKSRFAKGMDAQMDQFLTKYYDDKIMTPSLEVGGDTACNGFADCGLTLIMEHNTPNNSLAIFWADSPAQTSNHRMNSLFRRRQRHE